jgi:hypothetical protein
MTEDSETLLELYKTAVEMADRVSARRSGANTFFLTLNTALAAVVGIVSSARKQSPGKDLPSFDSYGLLVTAVAGVVLAFVWWLLLRYYRRLNAAKFRVISKLEERLPAKLYTDEWALLHPDEAVESSSKSARSWTDRWRRKFKHREASLVEQTIPFVFMGIYVALGIRVLMQ